MSDYQLRFAGIGRLYGVRALAFFQQAHVCVVGIGGVAVVFLFSYLASSNEVLDSYVKYNVTESSSQMIGAVLIMMYTLGLGSIVLAVVGEIYKAFK